MAPFLTAHDDCVESHNLKPKDGQRNTPIVPVIPRQLEKKRFRKASSSVGTRQSSQVPASQHEIVRDEPPVQVEAQSKPVLEKEDIESQEAEIQTKVPVKRDDVASHNVNLSDSAQELEMSANGVAVKVQDER